MRNSAFLWGAADLSQRPISLSRLEPSTSACTCLTFLRNFFFTFLFFLLLAISADSIRYGETTSPCYQLVESHVPLAWLASGGAISTCLLALGVEEPRRSAFTPG